MDKQVHKTFKSFLLSKKLWMTIFGLSVLWLAYWKQVDYLYSFTQPEQITAFVGITRDFMVAFTAAVMGFLGIEGIVSWKHGTESVVNQAASHISEKITKTENINIREEKFIHDDVTYQEDSKAPEAKPFGQSAVEE